MKIVHFTDYYQPAVGYQEANLAKMHKRLGHEVHVVTSERFFRFPNYEKTYQKLLGERIRVHGIFKEEGITVHCLPCFFEYPQSAFLLLKGIKKTLQIIQPDLLISHGIVGIHPFFSGRIKSQLGYKLIYDHHGAFYNTDLYENILKRIYLKFWDKFIRPTILKNADKIVAIGYEEREMARELLKIEREAISIIPLGADTDRFKPDSGLRVQGRRELAIHDEDLVIVYAGKLTMDKNIHLLLEAFCSIKTTRTKMKLLLIGNGDSGYVASLKQRARAHQVEDSLIWHDFVPNAELPKYFNAADIGVWTGKPANVIQEAIATGLPVILRDYPMNRFLVSGDIKCLSDKAHKPINEEALCGILIDSSKKDRLDGALLRLIENQKLRRRMSQLGRKNAIEYFSWQAIAREFVLSIAGKLS